MLYLHRISSRYPTCTYHYRVLQGGITSVAFDIKVIIIVLVNVQFGFSSSCSFGHFILWTLFHRKPNLLRFWFYLSASETKWTKSLDVVTLLAKVNASVSLTPLAFDLPTRWSQEKYFKEFSYYVCILEGIVALNFIHNSYVQQCSTATKTRTAKMQGYKWNFGLVIIAIALQVSVAAPNVRTKRQDIADIPDMDDLNPIEVEVSDDNGLDREKRKLPDAKFAAKNAIIGFVFSKIDNVLDTKTRFLDRLEQSNIEKNREYNITVPAPVKDFQGLITAVVSPKITAITNKLTGLTAGIFGTNSNGNSPAAQGLGSIVTKILRFSGPILQGSSGGAKPTEVSPTSDEAGY